MRVSAAKLQLTCCQLLDWGHGTVTRVLRHWCLSRGAASGLTAGGLLTATCRHLWLQVALDVWYPSDLALSAADTTLNSVMPINAAASTPACTSYQSTALSLTATFTNGGAAPSNTLLGADVTSFATFVSNDTNVAQVLGSMVKVCVCRFSLASNSVSNLEHTSKSCLGLCVCLASSNSGMCADTLIAMEFRSGKPCAVCSDVCRVLRLARPQFQQLPPAVRSSWRSQSAASPHALCSCTHPQQQASLLVSAPVTV